MRTIRTGQMAYDPSITAARLATIPRDGAYDPSIAGARLAVQSAPADNSDALTEAYLQATAPKAYAYAGGRMIYDRPPVKVSHICMRERRFRYAKITFNYDV